MAKLKVRELAEELNISNDDVKSFLASKGVDCLLYTSDAADD